MAGAAVATGAVDPEGLVLADVDLREDEAAPTDAPARAVTHLQALKPPTGRGTGRSWYLGRLGHTGGAPTPTIEAGRVTAVLAAGGGTGAGAGPAILADLSAKAPGDAWRTALCLLPRLREGDASGAVNAAYALGRLSRQGTSSIFLADPDHVEDLAATYGDPFRMGTDDTRTSLEAALVASLAGIEDLSRAGWGRRDLRVAFQVDRDPSYVVPAHLVVREGDLGRINLAGWVLAALEGGALASTRLEDADAIVVSARVPEAWDGERGLSDRDSILEVLGVAAPKARVEVEVFRTKSQRAAGRIHGYIVTDHVPKLATVARAGVAEAMKAGFASSLTKALEILGGVADDPAAGFVADYREAVEYLDQRIGAD